MSQANQNKKAVILVNVGSPDKPELKYVSRFLFQFLNDRRVIDLPLILQKILVNLIIIPFRMRKSTRLYKRLWTEKGSPLIYLQEQLKNKLNEQLGGEYMVYSVMRYGNPGLKELMKDLESKALEEIILLPLFPQYASSTSGSVFSLFSQLIEKWKAVPKLKKIEQFYNHPAFLDAFEEQSKKFKLDSYDHVIFSFHGLPLRHIQKLHTDIPLTECICEKEMPAHGKYCYKATCYETARLLVDRLKLPEDRFTVTFQSRMSENWLAPFTNDVILEKAKLGMKRILVFAPSFVVDCLETIIEIEQDYNDLFRKLGGVQLDMVEGLNDTEIWIRGLSDIVLKSK